VSKYPITTLPETQVRKIILRQLGEVGMYRPTDAERKQLLKTLRDLPKMYAKAGK
jgi:hypothetical protein